MTKRRLWLPVGSRPHLFAQDERAELENKLWDLRYMIPGSSRLEIQQLRDLVQWVEHIHATDEALEEAKERAGQAIVNKMTPQQQRDAMKEYLNWKARKQGKPQVHRSGT